MQEEEHSISRRKFMKMAALAAAALGSGTSLLEGCAPSTTTPITAPAPATGGAAVQAPTSAPAVAAAPKPQAATRPMVMVQRIDPITLDPDANGFPYSQWPQRASYESLVNYEQTADGKAKLVPMLASSWEVSADAKSFTLQLQKGVKFSDGSPFDAQAVKWNFDRIFSLKLQPRGWLPDFEKIDVLGETTVRITTKNPYASLMDILAKPLMVSPTAAQREVSGDQGQKWLYDHTVGTGPYILEGWVQGQQLTFAKNPNYYRGWSGNHLEKIVIELVKEPATQLMMLEKGDADLADGIAFDDLDALAKVPGVVVQHDTFFQLLHLVLRERGPLKDKRVRQAMQYAFDYDGFIKGVLNGRGEVAQGPLPPGIFGFDPTVPKSKRDVAKAKQLLAEAGYPNGGFSLVIWIMPPYGWFQSGEAQLLQQNLKELGIELKIVEQVNAAVYSQGLQQLDAGPDIYAWTFSHSFDDPNVSLRNMYYSTMTFPAGQNGGFYNNPHVDELLDKGISIGVQEERVPIYQELQRVILGDAPAIFVAQLDYFTTRREVLQGYPYYPFMPNNGPDWWKMWLSK